VKGVALLASAKETIFLAFFAKPTPVYVFFFIASKNQHNPELSDLLSIRGLRLPN